jgi:non-homologous end joining protein Ku
VLVDDEELKKIAPTTASTMDIVQFVHNDAVDPIYFESSYYVGPEENAASKLPPKEVELAKSSVQHLAGAFKPSEFHDSYSENIERLIEQKQKIKPVSAIAQPKRSPVIDLMEALKQSLAATPDSGGMARTGAGKRSKKDGPLRCVCRGEGRQSAALVRRVSNAAYPSRGDQAGNRSRERGRRKV